MDSGHRRDPIQETLRGHGVLPPGHPASAPHSLAGASVPFVSLLRGQADFPLRASHLRDAQHSRKRRRRLGPGHQNVGSRATGEGGRPSGGTCSIRGPSNQFATPKALRSEYLRTVYQKYAEDRPRTCWALAAAWLCPRSRDCSPPGCGVTFAQNSHVAPTIMHAVIRTASALLTSPSLHRELDE